MGADSGHVGAEIKHPAYAGDDRWQRADLGKPDGDGKAVPPAKVGDLDRSLLAILNHRSAVDLAGDLFNAIDGAGAQPGQHGVPVVRGPVAKLDGDADIGGGPLRQGHDGAAPQRRRRPPEQLLESLVEPPHATVTGGQRDLGHGQAGLMDQLLGEQNPTGLGHRHGRGAQMLVEQAAQLPLTDAEAFRKTVHTGILAVQGAVLDQGQGARHRVGRSPPGAGLRGCFRSAAEAGTEARLLGGGGGRKEAAMLELGRARRADRPAVDPGGGDPDEHAAVEAPIAGLKSPVANLRINQVHGPELAMGEGSALAVFGPRQTRRRARAGCAASFRSTGAA